MNERTQGHDDRVIIFDTTLRDGEQAPGCSMTLREKLRVAGSLRDLNVDVIEAGFAAASPGDFESVKAIAEVGASWTSMGRPVAVMRISSIPAVGPSPRVCAASEGGSEVATPSVGSDGSSSGSAPDSRSAATVTPWWRRCGDIDWAA